jgi:hypothetical protein
MGQAFIPGPFIVCFGNTWLFDRESGADYVPILLPVRPVGLLAFAIARSALAPDMGHCSDCFHPASFCRAFAFDSLVSLPHYCADAVDLPLHTVLMYSYEIEAAGFDNQVCNCLVVNFQRDTDAIPFKGW